MSADLVAPFIQPVRGDDHGQAVGSRRAHPLAESLGHGDSQGRDFDHGGRFVDPARGARATPFAPHVTFLKDEVFDICGALALGESVFTRLGLSDEATYLATVFDLVERRLVDPLMPATTGERRVLARRSMRAS